MNIIILNNSILVFSIILNIGLGTARRLCSYVQWVGMIGFPWLVMIVCTIGRVSIVGYARMYDG